MSVWVGVNIFFSLSNPLFSSPERPVGEGERMLDVLQRWGQHRVEVRFFLRHDRAPSRESGEGPL